MLPTYYLDWSEDKMNMYINIKEEHITRKEKPKDLNSK